MAGVFVMRRLIFLFCVVFIHVMGLKAEGFNLLFTSNAREYTNYQITLKEDIPEWITGTLLRNGLGQFEMGSTNFIHAFDGFAKLSSFKFKRKNGNASLEYSTKFIRTNFYERSNSTGKIAPYILFDAREPAFSVAEAAQALYNGIDNTNVNLYQIEESNCEKNCSKLLAVSDFWKGYEIDLPTLTTLSHVNAKLPVSRVLSEIIPLPSTSHPVKEYNKSSLVGFVSYLNPLPFFSSQIHVLRINGLHDRELITTISRTSIPYMHSLGLSKNFAILFADPLIINTYKVLKTLRPLESLDWFAERKTDIYVVNLKTGSIQTFITSPLIHLHHINSFERKNQIIVDYVAYPNINFLKNMTLSTLLDDSLRKNIEQNSLIVRYKINLKSNALTTKTEFISRKNRTFIHRLDFPTINENFRHKQYCFVYGVVLKSDDINLENSSLVKKDMCGGRDRFWSRVNHFPSEAIFVNDPTSAREDGGVLLSVVLNGNKGISYIAVFNATTMRIISKGNLPDFVPFTLHGEFINEFESDVLLEQVRKQNK